MDADFRDFLAGQRIPVIERDRRRYSIPINTAPHILDFRHSQAIDSLDDDEEPTEEIRHRPPCQLPSEGDVVFLVIMAGVVFCGLLELFAK